MSFKVGQWYPSKKKVREFYGEYWKGILVGKMRIAIIFNHRGARRKHYDDNLDLGRMRISYVGEGKSGDQIPNPRNKALIDSCNLEKAVDVFLDCGPVFRPNKHLLYVGAWSVASWKYKREMGRRVYRFALKPRSEEIRPVLRFMFGNRGEDRVFEKDLKAFAIARDRFYRNHSHILRARDSIAGEIGEYYAIKSFNRKNPDKPLIRLRGNFKDLDAVQIGTGLGFAIKTITGFPAVTSNIWADDIAEAVDGFIITHLNKAKLTPEFVCVVGAKKAKRIAAIEDDYQGSTKLRVNKELIRASKFVLGGKRKWTR